MIAAKVVVNYPRMQDSKRVDMYIKCGYVNGSTASNRKDDSQFVTSNKVTQMCVVKM